jgi:hypothetical protein
MPIKDVVRLILDTADSELLRNTLNQCGSSVESISFLNQNGYNFSQSEFNDAVRMLHLRCLSEEEAAFLMGKVMWLRYVLNYKSE